MFFFNQQRRLKQELKIICFFFVMALFTWHLLIKNLFCFYSYKLFCKNLCNNIVYTKRLTSLYSSILLNHKIKLNVLYANNPLIIKKREKNYLHVINHHGQEGLVSRNTITTRGKIFLYARETVVGYKKMPILLEKNVVIIPAGVLLEVNHVRHKNAKYLWLCFIYLKKNIWIPIKITKINKYFF